MHREMLHEYSTIMIFKGLFKLKRVIKYYHWNLEVLLISSIVLIVLLVLVLFILIHLNICSVPHLEMGPKCFTVATIALFSASVLYSHTAGTLNE